MCRIFRIIAEVIVDQYRQDSLKNCDSVSSPKIRSSPQYNLLLSVKDSVTVQHALRQSNEADIQQLGASVILAKPEAREILIESFQFIRRLGVCKPEARENLLKSFNITDEEAHWVCLQSTLTRPLHESSSTDAANCSVSAAVVAESLEAESTTASTAAALTGNSSRSTRLGAQAAQVTTATTTTRASTTAALTDNSSSSTRLGAQAAQVITATATTRASTTAALTVNSSSSTRLGAQAAQVTTATTTTRASTAAALTDNSSSSTRLGAQAAVTNYRSSTSSALMVVSPVIATETAAPNSTSFGAATPASLITSKTLEQREDWRAPIGVTPESATNVSPSDANEAEGPNEVSGLGSLFNFFRSTVLFSGAVQPVEERSGFKSLYKFLEESPFEVGTVWETKLRRKYKLCIQEDIRNGIDWCND